VRKGFAIAKKIKKGVSTAYIIYIM